MPSGSCAATTLAAVLGLVWYLGRASTYLRIDWAQWRPDWALWRRMLAIGLPSGAEFLIMSLILGLIYWVIRPFGAEAQAGLGVIAAFRLEAHDFVGDFLGGGAELVDRGGHAVGARGLLVGVEHRRVGRRDHGQQIANRFDRVAFTDKIRHIAGFLRSQNVCVRTRPRPGV